MMEKYSTPKVWDENFLLLQLLMLFILLMYCDVPCVQGINDLEAKVEEFLTTAIEDIASDCQCNFQYETFDTKHAVSPIDVAKHTVMMQATMTNGLNPSSHASMWK